MYMRRVNPNRVHLSTELSVDKENNSSVSVSCILLWNMYIIYILLHTANTSKKYDIYTLFFFLFYLFLYSR